MGGCDWDLRSFSVYPKAFCKDEKKCFFADCANEGKCSDCNLIQGKFWKYKPLRGIKSAEAKQGGKHGRRNKA